MHIKRGRKLRSASFVALKSLWKQLLELRRLGGRLLGELKSGAFGAESFLEAFGDKVLLCFFVRSELSLLLTRLLSAGSFPRATSTRAFKLKRKMSIISHQNGLDCNNQKKKFLNSKAESEEHEEHQYLRLIRTILEKGAVKDDRTGVGTHSIFGTQMRFDLRNGVYPLLTTKRVFFRAVVEELLWFIRGSTNANELSAKGVKIWDANASRQFLDSLGFHDREEGDLGPVYGFQWRHFGAKYVNMHTDYTGQGFDQLADVIHKIKHNPNDRRIIMSSWNPVDIPLMALPPCHSLAQFYVEDGELSCQLYQRAGDMGLGVPFNIASYALLTHMIAHVTNLKTGDFVHSMGDTHVYRNHVEAVKEQIQREPRPFPKLRIKRQVDDIESFEFSDFELEGYNPHPKLSMPMAL